MDVGHSLEVAGWWACEETAESGRLGVSCRDTAAIAWEKEERMRRREAQSVGAAAEEKLRSTWRDGIFMGDARIRHNSEQEAQLWLFWHCSGWCALAAARVWLMGARVATCRRG